jgi:hypothetical protein
LGLAAGFEQNAQQRLGGCWGEAGRFIGHDYAHARLWFRIRWCECSEDDRQEDGRLDLAMPDCHQAALLVAER